MISEIGKIIPVPLLELDTNSHASAVHAAFDRLLWLVPPYDWPDWLLEQVSAALSGLFIMWYSA